MPTLQEPKLVLTIKNDAPLDVASYTSALNALADEYHTYISKQPNAIKGEAPKLYIKEIRQGSIITELQDYLVAAGIPFLENINTLGDFAGKLKLCYDYFSGKSNDKPEMTTNSLKNASQIVNPVAKGNAQQQNLAVTVNGGVHIHFDVTKKEAQKIQKGIVKEIKSRNEPEHLPHEHVVFTWHVTKNDVKSDTGYQGKIESITHKALKVIIPDFDLKTEMLLGNENFFKYAYVVDVRVQVHDGVPIAYRIENLHEKFALPTPKSKRNSKPKKKRKK